jgi:DNA-binding IscR family transcriptional regulator
MYVSARTDHAVRAMLGVAVAEPRLAAYHGAATGLRDVWLAVHSAIEDVVDHRSLADLLTTSTTP